MGTTTNFSGIGTQPSFSTPNPRGGGPQPSPNSHFGPRPRRKMMPKRGLPKMSMKTLSPKSSF